MGIKIVTQRIWSQKGTRKIGGGKGWGKFG